MSSPKKVLEGEVVAPEQSTNGKKPSKRGAIAKREPSAIASTRQISGIEDLMAKAVDSGNIDMIERVFALRQELKREAAKEAFFDALSLFQSIVPAIPKNKRGYNYWYAPLGTIEQKIAPSMEKCGLSKRWRQEETPDTVKMFCIISHRGGHSEETPLGPVPWDLLEKTSQMNSLQHRSAVLTYLERYTLTGALGLASVDDDPDGVIPSEARAQQAEQRRQPVSQPQAKPTAQKKKVTPEQGGARAAIVPAPEGEGIEASTIKVLTSKMEHAALSNGDLMKRFPAITGIKQVNRKDINVVLGWLLDPQNA